MQYHVYKSQIDAAIAFLQFKSDVVPENVVQEIKLKAMSEWPDDYDMRFHVLTTQIEAWLELHGSAGDQVCPF